MTDSHPEPNYMAVFYALTVLTVAEIGVASWTSLGRPTIITGLLVMAFTKAAMVALWYMHLKFEKWLLYLICAMPILLVCILIGFTMPDIGRPDALTPLFGEPYKILHYPKGLAPDAATSAAPESTGAHAPAPAEAQAAAQPPQETPKAAAASPVESKAPVTPKAEDAAAAKPAEATPAEATPPAPATAATPAEPAKPAEVAQTPATPAEQPATPASAAPATEPAAPAVAAPTPAPAAQAAAAAAAPSGPAGPGLSGRVAFEGTAPTMRKIRMDAEMTCKAAHAETPREERVVVNSNQTLRNVFVYVKSPVPAGGAPAAGKVTIDQNGCQYRPHVMGIQVGQTLEILNSDTNVLHNIHSFGGPGNAFNMGQPGTGAVLTKTFEKPEVMVKLKCDVHGWMSAYVGVLEHPFFSVTDEKGEFHIPKLPAGEYTVEAWHEEYGAQEAKVTVGADGSGTAAFKFQAK